MPNWVANNLDIEGDVEQLRKFAEYEEGKFFENIMPLGEWDRSKSVEGWGTKWDVDPYHCELDEESSVLSVSFDSAWTPPINFYDYLQSKGFSVYASYYEPGQSFAGIYENGEDRSYEEFNEGFFQTVDGTELDACFAISEDLQSWDEEEEDD